MAYGRYLFVSDLHLSAALPRALDAFDRFLSGDASRCDGLYILGDLFERSIGDDDDDATHRRICAALRTLTSTGVSCRVQHGNRDFLLGAGFVAATGCELVVDPLLLETGGRRFIVSHGDALCTGDLAYQRFRRFVRNRSVQRGWLALPLRLRRGLAGYARRRSHVHTRQQPAALMDVAPAAVSALLRDSRADVLIHGHTHRPGIHALQVDGRDCVRIVLGDWYTQASMLELRADGHYELRTLDAAAPC